MTQKSDYGFETIAVHAGASPDPVTGARATPIYQTSSYVFEDVDQAASLFNLQTFGNIYTRLTNPTVSVLEERVATLEGGAAALAVASGHAAQMVLMFALLEPGENFVASSKLYGGSITQFGTTFQKMGWHCTFCDPDDPDSFPAAIDEKTKAIFIESSSNPGGVITDIERFVEIAHAHGIPLIVDNTCASPWGCRPFDWGADLVVHSATKYLGGHGNSVGGVIVESGDFDWAASGRFPSIAAPCPAYHGLNFYETFGRFAVTAYGRAVGLRDLGPALSPFNAFLILTGIETLPLRMERHTANAQQVAEYLADHDQVDWVSFAGLPGAKYETLQKKYLPKGAAPLFTFGLKGGYDAGVKLVESVNLFSHLANIGETRSLILHPASTTHRQLTGDQQIAAGAGPDVVRLSIGIETIDDIIADLDQALAQF
ncbi:O-acetylhomoserine aminocarboxypropyltransferase [Minwuia sp.]|uniref:O-acetylhomoserine aminocarboxypropyltransferase n=1 Tax=Minwuia sp. TaxID=2493630 RepID=UPI003A94FC17